MSSYFEMIADGLTTLADRKGSSRQALWKCVSAKYPNADYKQFLVRLRKITRDGKEISMHKQRYRLNSDFKSKVRKAMEKGEIIAKVHKTNATMKKSKKQQKKRQGKNKAK